MAVTPSEMLPSPACSTARREPRGIFLYSRNRGSILVKHRVPGRPGPTPCLTLPHLIASPLPDPSDFLRWACSILLSGVLLLSASVPARSQQEYDGMSCWSQHDFSWGSDYLLYAYPVRLTDRGCSLTVAAMILNYYGFTHFPDGQEIDPSTLNYFLKVHRAYFDYNTNNINWIKLANLMNAIHWLCTGARCASEYTVIGYWHYNEVHDVRPDESYVQYFLSLGYPVHARVWGTGCETCPDKHSILLLHWTRFLGYAVANPARLEKYVCSEFGFEDVPEWNKVCVIVPTTLVATPSYPAFAAREVAGAQAPTAATEVDFSAASVAAMVITDPLGHRFGRDSAGTVYTEIPSATETTLEVNSNDDPSGPPEDGREGVDYTIPEPSAGTYSVRVWGDSSTVGSIGASRLGLVVREDFAGGGGNGVAGTLVYSLPAVLTLQSVADGATLALAEGLLFPTVSDTSRLFLMEPDLGSGLYVERPGPGGLESLDLSNGSSVEAAGTVANIGGERRLQTTALTSLPSVNGNAAPIARMDSFQLAGGTSLFVAKADLLSNDSDTDGDSLDVFGVGATPEIRGAVSVVGDSIRYVPDLNYVGPANFAYGVSDGRGGLAAAAVLVEVLGTSAVEQEAPWADLAIKRVWPNPARRQLIIEFRLRDASPARVELVDLSGRVVAEREVRGAASGWRTIVFNSGRPLAPGVYHVRLTQSGRHVAAKVILLR